MKATVSTSTWLCTARLAACVLMAPPQIALAQALAPSALGALTVHVTRAGAAAASATVCIGVANDLNLHDQGTTDAQGNARFSSVPRDAFMVTANQAGRGAQRSVAPASPNVPLLRIDLALPASGGPARPSTAAGSARTLGPRISREQVPRLTAPVTLPSIPTARTEFCFGAIGAECGQPQANLPGAALCRLGVCFINGGSWEHDECCFDHRSGETCDFNPLHAAEAARDRACVAAWNKAVRLTSKGLSWSRAVDFTRGNSTGTVEFALYCAAANTWVPPEDANKCCSGQTRLLSAAEAATALAAMEPLRACR